MRLRSPQVAVLVAALVGLPAAAHAPEDPPPRTGFEEREGASWTTHEEEVAFLEEVADRSHRARLQVIGETLEGRPLHLVVLGEPSATSASAARREPTSLFVCTQHGNEPAGREACLQWLRDLAFTTDPGLVGQLRDQTVLFVPTANPDGREHNTRGNATGTDINRDHLTLATPEGQAIGAVVRDWQPEVAADLHEYGPSVPLLYDDEVLYLWPRNLNVHEGVRAMARTLGNKYVAPGAEEAGFTADEYGVYSVDPDGHGGTDFHLHQSAGGADEGISRNALGLRHALGFLVETAVTADPRNGSDELTSTAAVQRRRVAAHVQVVSDTLRFMRDLGLTAADVTARAAEEKTAEGRDRSAPVFFDGQDEDRTVTQSGSADPSVVADPPPCGYLLDPQQAADTAGVFELHGIGSARQPDGSLFVDMGQPAEPLVPLLLDARGDRHAVAAEPLDDCSTMSRTGRTR